MMMIDRLFVRDKDDKFDDDIYYCEECNVRCSIPRRLTCDECGEVVHFLRHYKKDDLLYYVCFNRNCRNAFTVPCTAIKMNDF